jgi:hypothetical protein
MPAQLGPSTNLSKNRKFEFNEAEAAAELNIPVERFRDLIRQHILKDESGSEMIPITRFQHSDLLLLRLFV